ncbi:MAG: argininosuccinate lyase, partial [Chitinophagaceae bacterium]
DLQLLKEHLIPAFENLHSCITMAALMLTNVVVNENILTDEKYKYLFSVEEVNKMVIQGVPFRDAYKKIGQDIENGNFKYSMNVNHTHEGSIGNLQNAQISAMMRNVVEQFNFSKVHGALEQLLR